MEKRLDGIRMVFLDMDGTIYHGGTLFPTTVPFLDFLKARGIGHAFLSNNSSFSTAEYVEKLRRMGIESTPENFYTSTCYTIDYLKRNHPGIRRIHLFGMPRIRPEFEEAGFELTDTEPQAVVVAFHRAFHYDDLCRAARFLRQGVPGFATHPDVYCPTDRPTWLPDCGAITKCLEVSTNTKLRVLGKPDPGMLREAAARRGVPVSQCLMAGDRLSTDIALGRNAGALTCHILTPGADLVVPENIRPDFQVNNLGELKRIWEHV
ncbi:MAG: HAD-IIA family hydrolase [Lentisphaeria bacterium]|nr:HAD-IIA family hydrolase [Lentisphaeria bacterium]